MIADFKPYTEYKESGLPWLGQVPTHWLVRRIKTVLRETDCRSTDGSGTLLSLTRIRGLISHNEMTDKMHSARTLVGYKRYRPGQIVMNRMQAWSGMFGAGAIDGLVSPDYTVFDVLSGHEIKLVLERLKTPDLVGQFALESKGIGSGFNRLYTDRFGPILISLPPPEEQAAIVRFLGWTNGRLERTIKAKRKLITLLNEQKQAIIHRAVTRGLDQSAPLKPSGIPWLGDIPKHWEVKPLKRIAWFKGGTGFPIGEQGKESLAIPFLKVSDMTKSGNDRWIESENNTITRESAQRLGAFVFPEHSIIFPKVGGAMLTNKRRLLKRPSCIDNNIMGCVVRHGDLDFVFLLLQQLDFGRLSKPGPVPAIGEGEVREIKVCIPPIYEQPTIVRQVAEETRPLNNAMSRLEREIALLREYRTRLVADVVTGKLDVREAAGRLPKEAAPDNDKNNDETELSDEEVAV